MLPVLRFNFASPDGDAQRQGELIRAAVELAQWGESRGTSTLIASIDCALGPLWNPVRLAEDIALVDNMSRGRLHTTVGLGHRESEYDALGIDFSQHGRLMDSLIERMLAGREGVTGAALVAGGELAAV